MVCVSPRKHPPPNLPRKGGGAGPVGLAGWCHKLDPTPSPLRGGMGRGSAATSRESVA
jgi:hypothetical protein